MLKIGKYKFFLSFFVKIRSDFFCYSGEVILDMANGPLLSV